MVSREKAANMAERELPPKPSGWNSHQQSTEGAFSDSEYHTRKHQQQRQDGKKELPPPRPGRRWSFVLEDIPQLLKTALHDVNYGYMARVSTVIGVSACIGYATYYTVCIRWQDGRPLARRPWLSPPVPITLIGKSREGDSTMWVYTFSLPNSYDYAGYSPVSSVQIISGRRNGLTSTRRWYTPISHPDQRGTIEFAIKDCDPGRMSGRIRSLRRGETLHLGRWMREFDVKQHVKPGDEVGLVCTTSGASIALQMMSLLSHTPDAQKWKLRVLYCHRHAQYIPFQKNYFDVMEKKYPSHVRVQYNVLSGGQSKSSSSNLFMGHVDPETIQATMPPPLSLRKDGDEAHFNGSDSSAVPTAYRPYILVCGPQSMLAFLCGNVSSVGNSTYWQGPFYGYSGILKDMGYARSQVYKFGVSTNFSTQR